RAEITIVSFIVIPGHTNAELGNESIREKTIVVETNAIRVLDAGALKVALCGPARRTENGRLENGWTLVAESAAQAVLVGQVGVHLHINEICIFVERQQSKVVVGVAGGGWSRQERHELCRDRVNQGDGNDVGATSGIGTSRIVSIHHTITTGYRRYGRSRRGDHLLAARAVRITAKRIVNVAGSRRNRR